MTSLALRFRVEPSLSAGKAVRSGVIFPFLACQARIGHLSAPTDFTGSRYRAQIAPETGNGLDAGTAHGIVLEGSTTT